MTNETIVWKECPQCQGNIYVRDRLNRLEVCERCDGCGKVSSSALFEVVMTNGNCGLATFRVHRTGCRDIALESSKTHGHSWSMDQATAKEVVAQLKLDQEADSNPFADDEYEIAPCAKGR